MKKLMTLTFALMLTASMAFAQNNVAETEQTGTGHSATIDQTGAGNFGEIEQGGTNSTAIIEQVGNDNAARRFRENLNSNLPGIDDVGVDNFTHVRQVGDNNVADVGLTIRGKRNDIRIDQGVEGDLSTGSEVFVSSKGEDNIIDVDQRGSSQSARVFVDKALGGNGLSNDIDVLQTGSDNDSQTYVNGSSNIIDVSQDGSLNLVDIDLGNRGDGISAHSNTVDVTQSGMGHTATVSVMGGSGNSSTITQSN